MDECRLAKSNSDRTPPGGACAASDDRAIRIFQIFYLQSQVSKLEPEFIPYSNIANPRPEWCEYHVFHKEYHSQTCDHGMTGFLSWKFGQKTGLSGARFLAWIEDNPGYDVYFVNPFPQRLQKLRPNVWYQAERCHPGLTDMAEMLLAKAGYKLNLRRLRMDEQTVAYCNFWVATPGFWQRYMEFTEPVYEIVEYGLTKKEKASLFSPADRVSRLCYIPYIFERLFSTLLCVDKSIRVLRMPTAAVRPFTYYDWFWREVSRPYHRCMARRTRSCSEARSA